MSFRSCLKDYPKLLSSFIMLQFDNRLISSSRALKLFRDVVNDFMMDSPCLFYDFIIFVMQESTAKEPASIECRMFSDSRLVSIYYYY